MTTKKELQKLLEKLKKGKISKNKITALITKFGEEQFKEARGEVEKYLESKDDMERYSALSTLVFEWGVQEIRPKIEKMMFLDPDTDLRMTAVACLGSLARCTKDLRAIKLLLKIFMNPKEDWSVRNSAYDAILHIMCVPYNKRPAIKEGLLSKKEIDFKLLKDLGKKILKQKSRLKSSRTGGRIVTTIRDKLRR